MNNIQKFKLKLEEDKTYYITKKASNPQDIVDLCKEVGLCDNAHEVVSLLGVDRKGLIIGVIEVGIGGLGECRIDIALCLKSILTMNAEHAIIVHNHPSGSLKISPADINLAERISESMKLVGLDLIDSIIVNSEEKYKSLREERVACWS